MVKRVFSIIGCIFVVLNYAGCSTGRFKPCTLGGQPARESTSPSLIGLIKKCHQIVNKDGYIVNHGEYYEWYQTDKIALTGKYEQGKKTGRWIEYDPEGNKVSDKYYEEGKEVNRP
jgi:hypothetical protein